MDKFKDLAKNGWNPDKDEKTFKGQVGAVFGRKSADTRANRDTTPISQLRDPASFAPPPKRVDNGGVLPPPPPSSSSLSRPATASSPGQGYSQYEQHQQQQHGVEQQEPPPPPRPYRVDTTGLSTTNLPPPPKRRDGADGGVLPPPPPYTAGHAKPPPPSLPPRLPPRQNTASPGATPQLPSPGVPSRQTGYLNQGAVDRLGGAGVSVPGLGIGGSTTGGGNNKPPVLPPPRSAGGSPGPATSGSSAGLNELQARFSKFGVGKSSSAETTTASPPPPSQGTTWAQKQAALKTMSDFKKDPSSVSFSDARNAASTANNFRERHGEQVASGMKTANSLDQKYGVSGKVGGYLGNQQGSSNGNSGQSHLNTIGTAAGMLGKKKPPPPPPPKKKPEIAGGAAARDDDDTPPPVPMSTRPF